MGKQLIKIAELVEDQLLDDTFSQESTLESLSIILVYGPSAQLINGLGHELSSLSNLFAEARQI